MCEQAAGVQMCTGDLRTQSTVPDSDLTSMLLIRTGLRIPGGWTDRTSDTVNPGKDLRPRRLLKLTERVGGRARTRTQTARPSALALALPSLRVW